jgi:hypothetical protein
MSEDVKPGPQCQRCGMALDPDAPQGLCLWWLKRTTCATIPEAGRGRLTGWQYSATGLDRQTE